MNIYIEPAASATETATDSTAPQAQSWRDVLPIHPAAELFPRMSPDELRELGEDIKANRLTSSIALWQAGPDAPLQLLDGRNRLDALQLVMGGPVCVVYEPIHKRSSEMMWSIKAGEDWIADEKVIVLDSSIDPTTYVISVNAHRRHLKPEQKREVIANLIKLQPEKSDRQIAETVKASPTTVGTVRAEMESTVQIGQLPKRVGKDGKSRKQPNRARGTIHRTMKLGEDTIAKIKGTALDRADEMDALIKLNRGAAPGTLTKDVQQLVDAAAGKNVSAIAYTAKIRGRSAPSRVSKTTRDNIGPASTGEIEEAKEVRKTEDEGEESELGNLLLAWDRASQGAREKFKAHVGLVAVEPPAKAINDGLDILECLRRAAP